MHTNVYQHAHKCTLKFTQTYIEMQINVQHKCTQMYIKMQINVHKNINK